MQHSLKFFNMKKFSLISFVLAIIFAVGISADCLGQDKTIKRKVAIGRFSNETQYGKGLFYNRENDPMAKQALDILSSKLASTEKFILLERDDLDVLMKETDGNMQKIGADYVILGSITQFGRKVEGEQGVFSSSKTQTVEATVSMRLVDVASGLIIYSDEGKGFAETTSKKTLGVGGTADFDATLSDKAISMAISKLVENVINKCLDKPWRGYLLAYEDGTYVMSGGASQGISVGDTFAVYSKGKKVKNPQSGVEVELPGKKLGTVTITMLYGETPETEVSFCSYEGAELDLNKLTTDYYVMEK